MKNTKILNDSQENSPNEEIQDLKREDGELLQLVSFTLFNEEFGVDILKVQEIHRVMEITNVPKSADFIDGVVNLRGRVIPVISLRKRFGFPKKEYDKNTRIIIVEIGGKIVGFIVDSVAEVLRIPSGTIEPPPSLVASIDAEYIKGVGKLENRLLILLDLDKVLSNGEVDQLDKAA